MATSSNLSKKERRRELVKTHLLDEHLIAIGHVAIRAAVLDITIEHTVDAIELAYPEIVRREVKALSTPDKLKLIKQVLQSEMPGHENGIGEFVSEVNGARDERNAIIHRLWSNIAGSPEEKALVDPRRLTTAAPRKVTAKSMRNLATRMIDLTFELSDWKMLNNDIRRRQWLASHGKPPLPVPPPIPPRTSPKDQPKGPPPKPLRLGS
jgi:hypothetical protein